MPRALPADDDNVPSPPVKSRSGPPSEAGSVLSRGFRRFVLAGHLKLQACNHEKPRDKQKSQCNMTDPNLPLQVMGPYRVVRCLMDGSMPLPGAQHGSGVARRPSFAGVAVSEALKV